MRPLPVALIAPALLIAASAGFSAPKPDAQEVQFTFNPPAPSSHTLAVRITKVKDPGNGAKQTDVALGKETVTIKKTPTGYSVVHTPVSFSFTRNGEKVSNPVADVLQKIVVTHELDAEGRLVSIQGFDQLSEKVTTELKKTLTPERFQSISTMIPGIKQSAIDKETYEWKARVTDFVGKRARIGDVWSSTDTAEMAVGGSIEFNSKLRFQEMVKRGNVNCVRLVFSYEADASKTTAFIQKWMDQMSRMPNHGQDVPKILGIAVTGSGERLVDPKTMLIYAESLNRTTTMQFDVSGEGVKPLIMQETQEFTYDYGQTGAR